MLNTPPPPEKISGYATANTLLQRFIFWGDAGVRVTLNFFVNLTGESKNFKMLEFQLQTFYGYLCDWCPLTAFIYFFSDLNYKIVIFLSQTESTP
jgi:hypothetical protein